LENLPAAEGQELAGEMGGSLACFANLFYVRPDRVGSAKLL
jgi:hypothetical protein